MKPIDLRNATWADVMAHVSDARMQVHNMLTRCGPCTCRQLADQIGVDVLSVAPRVTELFALGFVELVGKQGRRGIYKALTVANAFSAFERRKAESMTQPELNLKGV